MNTERANKENDTRAGDTAIGGNLRTFPSTSWSRLGEADDPEARAAILEDLARRYWKPVYAHIRARRNATNEDAKDLAQDFFLWMMETDFPSRADRSRGRFRAFIKTALNRYLGGVDRKARSLKRGGDRTLFFLDPTQAGESLFDLPSSAGRSPDELLDETWRAELLSRALRRLEEEYRSQGKETHYRVFRDFCVAESPEASYEELASRYGISQVDVSNYLARAKDLFRSMLKDEVMNTVGDQHELLEEWKSLFGKPSE